MDELLEKIKAIFKKKRKASVDAQEDGEIKVKSSFLTKLKNLSTPIKILIVSGICVVLAVAVALMAVFIPKNKSKELEAEPTFTRQVYCYAVRTGDDVGVALDDEWMMNCNANIFTIDFDGEKVVVENGILKAKTGQNSDFETDVKYKYKGEVVAIFHVKGFKDATTISTFAELSAIPEGSTENYILNADLDLSSNKCRIKDFHGGFYGNHHTIRGYSISSDGGLFDVAFGAEIYSLNLTSVSGDIYSSGLQGLGICNRNSVNSIGALVNYAYNTDIKYCSVVGRFGVTSTEVVGSLNIGGMVGCFDDDEKRTDADYNINIIEYCTADVIIDASCTYVSTSDQDCISVGSLVGNNHNGSVSYSKSAGKLTINSSNIERLYIGGLVGYFAKESSNFATDRIHKYDTVQSLESATEVSVTISGDNAMFSSYIGGVMGYASNVNIAKISYLGTLTANLDKSAIAVGGICGALYNTHTNGVIMNMSITEIESTGIQTINSKHNYNYGEVSGYTSEQIEMEKINNEQ